MEPCGIVGLIDPVRKITSEAPVSAVHTNQAMSASTATLMSVVTANPETRRIKFTSQSYPGPVAAKHAQRTLATGQSAESLL